MLNDYHKALISEYADDELDLETTRQVSEFIDKNREAEEYFHKLQSLRRLFSLGDTTRPPSVRSVVFSTSLKPAMTAVS